MTRTLLFTALLLLATPAHAAYTGPQEMPKIFTTVLQVQEYPIDDHQVTLTGRITKRIGHDKYLFRDNSGAIRLEIDDDVFPPQDIDETTHLRIQGEIDAQALDNPGVDVIRIDILGPDQPGNR